MPPGMQSPFQYIPQANMPRGHGASPAAPAGQQGASELTPAPTNTLETVANLEVGGFESTF